MPGKVYLVGAGPGDPELLTLKAIRVLREADTVLYDALVSAEIVDLIPGDCVSFNVGKRCGPKAITQDQINGLMISLARSGRTVVRLKSGDPLIFGRAGEEIEALRRSRIEFEIVPGITAALSAAAAAQVSLTHRDVASSVTFVTAHRADNSHINWKHLASSDSTIAFYMPGQSYCEISQRLLDAGMEEDVPCLLVAHASLENEIVRFSTVGKLAEDALPTSPSILLVGRALGAHATDACGLKGRLADLIDLTPIASLQTGTYAYAPRISLADRRCRCRSGGIVTDRSC